MSKKILSRCLLVAAVLVVVTAMVVPADAADVRAVYRDLERQRVESEQLKKTTETRIGRDRDQLGKTLAALQHESKELERELERGQKELQQRQQQVERLTAEQAADRELMTNLTAAVRVSARQLQELVTRSVYTAFDPRRPDRLDPILDGDHFPGLDDMELMADEFFNEMTMAGQVSMPEHSYVDGAGETRRDQLLVVGPFLAVVADTDKPLLLSYNSARRNLAVLDGKLPWAQQRTLVKYLRGESEQVPLDLAAGAGLEQLTRQKGFVERIRSGGVLIWPILLLALVAVVISLERSIFLKRVHDRADLVMDAVNQNACSGDWEACDKLIGKRRSPVYNVLRAGLQARYEQRDVLESILQEAILKELPRLERALPLLNIMGAVAPLLGLLGTVTGMIGTFEVINIYGTGDPRLMSGGISVALVTTMLGLMVAIPIMLMHTFLSRQVEHIIGDMEEKSVTLINTIARCKLPHAHESAA